MGDTFIFIMGLVCTGAVIAATFLSINELKDVNEPSVKTMDVAEGAKRHLKLISTAILIIIGFVVGFILQIILYDTNFGPGSDYIIGIIISWSYFCLMHSSKHQATVGMKMCKIKICDQNFKKITLGRATLRYFSAPLSGLILLIGFFMIGFTKKKQGLHDIFTKTLHVNN